MKIKKSDLANWYVEEHSDCGHICYFTNDRRASITEDEFYKWLMKKKKCELIELIGNHSQEGQQFLKNNNPLTT